MWNYFSTVNYETVYHGVKKIVTTSKFYLIEALAGKIASDLLKSNQIEKVTVRIRKPNAPLKGVLDYVEVEVIRCKGDMA